jgi:hypothetical protein
MRSKLLILPFIVAISFSPFGLQPIADKLTLSPQTKPEDPESLGAWRLVRSSAPDGVESAAILHTAEFERSNSRLAGLMFRCVGRDIESIIVVVEPFPPRAHPQIVLRTEGQKEANFVGTIIPTGAGIRLPDDATKLLAGRWHTESELEIRVNDGDATFDGAILLSGLPKALQTLSSECVQK